MRREVHVYSIWVHQHFGRREGKEGRGGGKDEEKEEEGKDEEEEEGGRDEEEEEGGRDEEKEVNIEELSLYIYFSSRLLKP